MRILTIVVFFSSFLAIQSCVKLDCGTDSKQFVERYEKWFTDVSTNYEDIESQKWKNHDKTLHKYLSRCYDYYSESLSIDDKQTIWSNAVKYYYYRYDSDMVDELQNEDNPTSVLIMEELEEFWSSPDQMLKEILGEDMENLVDDFFKDVDKWAKKLEEFLSGDKK